MKTAMLLAATLLAATLLAATPALAQAGAPSTAGGDANGVPASNPSRQATVDEFEMDRMRQERRAWREAMKSITFVPADFAGMVEGRFEQGDTDKDGKLSLAELRALDVAVAREGIIVPLFALDQLRASDRKANPIRARLLNFDARILAAADTDGDGALTPMEALRQILSQFRGMDRNNDSVLSGSEIDHFLRREARKMRYR